MKHYSVNAVYYWVNAVVVFIVVGLSQPTSRGMAQVLAWPAQV
jgi:hypothetical protein